jgi:oxygen-independent coproporphyrinogen-3 oxidase
VPSAEGTAAPERWSLIVQTSATDTSLSDWIPDANRLGVYLHLPFCVQRCGYCSFNTAPYEPGAMDRFLGALCAEIDLVTGMPWAAGRMLRTIFFGGGTPSLASEEEMAALLERLQGGFALAPGAEITVECNPESVSRRRLEGYRRAGVNRISLGVQSLDDRILGRLHRLHSARQAHQAFEAAREAGFDNISADLIYGLPGLDGPVWERTLHDMLAWEPDHVSAYALTLDEGSLWQAAGVTDLPDEDEVSRQYWALTRLAREAGYEHYEVSNYARPCRRSAHNQIYWRAEEYLALGPGAAGFLGAVRYANVKPVERYCSLVERGAAPVATHEVLTVRQRIAERLILGLRLVDGIPTAWLDERIRLEAGRLPMRLAAWRERGLLVEAGGRARLTEEGFLLSDALFVELL